MNNPIHIAFANLSLKEAYFELEKRDFEDKQLFSFLQRAIEDLSKNPDCGIKIAKKLWPKKYLKHDITKLWKYNLPNAWELVYTIKQDEVSIVSMILEWFNHKTYERSFNYLFI